MADLREAEGVFSFLDSVLDEYTLAIGKIWKTPKEERDKIVNLQAIFATQLALDCIHILGKDLERPFREWRSIHNYHCSLLPSENVRTRTGEESTPEI